FKEVKGKENVVNLSNGVFQAYSFNNAKLQFRDMGKIVFGSLSNSEFQTETSKIQIGEIKENVSIKDFNGTYYLNNFKKDLILLK
ncbi:MAG: hypothetical protein HC798_04505, partial [Polaribacter sp.]|nr:hypothetical protein [Polaribacter sp.]